MFSKGIKKSNNTILGDKKIKISNTKLLALILVGIVGLYIFGAIAEAITKAIPGLTASEQSGVTNFIAYSFLFISLLAVLNKDILKLRETFKNWKNNIMGIVIGFIIIAVQMGYSNIVNLFYHTNVSDNEASLRSFISIYPVLSIIILCFVGPFCEELTYRVGLFGLFKNNKVLAYVVSVLIFSLMHFNPLSSNIVNELINLPMYILSAIGLTYSYDKYGLAGSYTSHCLNNIWSVVGIIILQNLG